MQPILAVTVAFFELVLCIALPGPLAQIIRMLADAATSVALFTIRAVMWRAGQHAHTRTPIAQYLPVALFKLAIHPALVLGVGMLAHAAGLRASTFVLTVLVLPAPAPCRCWPSATAPTTAVWRGSSWSAPCWRSAAFRCWRGGSAWRGRAADSRRDRGRQPAQGQPALDAR